jgi:hypothetical protein
LGAVDGACSRQFPQQRDAGDDPRGASTFTDSGKLTGDRLADESVSKPDDIDYGAACSRHNAGRWRCTGSGQAAGFRSGFEHERERKCNRG